MMKYLFSFIVLYFIYYYYYNAFITRHTFMS